ncbi:MAG TPA: hypothetical protein VFM53_07800 [Anaeromyxobacteraceae bacterium]|nr:hypothetical protein [Anaeromyxobacteraceae bacterium]
MRRMAWAVLAMAAMAFAVPTLAEDSPGDAETTDSARKASDAVVVEDIRSGAGSMEPGEDDAQEAAERAFVENVWNSP